ncbi:hypothetical protein PGRAN_02580 [Listeria grandensis FSL F6-0971]|uniref:Uncharacterized protein n=1 Tax=Listeria grandensis FSL F6-0971 TaxID=1265819 RepID=W7BJ05_9LIST|nr:hypothetical protein [Listeria grandensis]EUJ24745.1 hypothetical protein PGRAN_02580 [Listeria grandensis FSL F6-0971]
MNKWRNALYSSLDELRGSEVSSEVDGILLVLGIELGIKVSLTQKLDSPILRIQERIDYLVTEKIVYEEFIVRSVFSRIDELLTEHQKNRFNVLLNWERALDSEILSDEAEAKIKQIKSKVYELEIIKLMDTWSMIKCKYYSQMKQEEYKFEFTTSQLGKLGALPDEAKDKTFASLSDE